MSSYLGFVIGGYLLGSILFAYVLPKLTRHIDIREMSEDGNPGTYNAFRYGGTVCGILSLIHIYAAGEIRLVVPQNLSSFGKALILCNIVKNAVVIQRHDPCLLLYFFDI